MIRVSIGSSGCAHWWNSASRIWFAPSRVTMSGRSRYCGSVIGPRPTTRPLSADRFGGPAASPRV